MEIPVAGLFLTQHAKGKSVLEVGNVLSNYKSYTEHIPEAKNRIIIDKFEVSPGVVNLDLMDITEKYDMIVSVSTIEHVGQMAYGENITGDTEAPLKAIVQIYNLLKPGGKACITVPFGLLMDLGWFIQFSSDYTELLTRKYGIPAKALNISYLKKFDTEVSHPIPRQLWIQCQEYQMENCYFNSPFIFANGIAVLYLDKVGEDIPSETVVSTNLNYHSSVLLGGIYFDSSVYKTYEPDLNGWMTVSNSGIVFYGPYLNLAPNHYYLQAVIEMDRHDHFIVDITADYGRKQLWRKEITGTTEIIHVLRLSESESNVEVRLHKISSDVTRVRVANMYLGIR
ncbi:MAG: hypothetical protein ACE3L7_03920 [Candidatus Pristimantibacillus sp.]